MQPMLLLLKSCLHSLSLWILQWTTLQCPYLMLSLLHSLQAMLLKHMACGFQTIQVSGDSFAMKGVLGSFPTSPCVWLTRNMSLILSGVATTARVICVGLCPMFLRYPKMTLPLPSVRVVRLTLRWHLRRPKYLLRYRGSAADPSQILPVALL